MAIIRAFEVVETVGKNELVKHTYIDDAAVGGEIILTAERVAASETPTKAGFIETLRTKSIIISITNNDANVIWTTKPDLRGIHNSKVINPGYDDGSNLPSECEIGSFLSSLAADEEDMIQADPNCAPYGITLRAKAPAQDLDLTTWVLTRRE